MVMLEDHQVSPHDQLGNAQQMLLPRTSSPIDAETEFISSDSWR